MLETKITQTNNTRRKRKQIELFSTLFGRVNCKKKRSFEYTIPLCFQATKKLVLDGWGNSVLEDEQFGNFELYRKPLQTNLSDVESQERGSFPKAKEAQI